MVKLFVANISDNVSEIRLIEMFSLHALVSSIKLIVDKQSGKNLYGFVEVQDKFAADRAIEALDGLELGGKRLNVKIAEERAKTFVKKGSGNKGPEAGKFGGSKFTGNKFTGNKYPAKNGRTSA
ncbi:hypothetical protein [Pedobacter sp. JY14-1]|uniref:RNA recognition motif domain-containing protein n=1 Tax=Pedobacter sp. JY14-1 TaxID=3034151 RepID=UPI0023E13C31|nr:hypothetical protein [Pedobacter sp. JY14-1]